MAARLGCLWTVYGVCLCTGALTTTHATEKVFPPTRWRRRNLHAQNMDIVMQMESHFRFVGTRRCSPKRTTVVLQASHSFLTWRNWHKSRKGGNASSPSWSHALDLPIICCKLCIVPCAKEGTVSLNGANHVILLLLGAPPPKKKKIFRKCVSVKAVKDYVVTFFLKR